MSWATVIPDKEPRPIDEGKKFIKPEVRPVVMRARRVFPDIEQYLSFFRGRCQDYGEPMGVRQIIRNPRELFRRPLLCGQSRRRVDHAIISQGNVSPPEALPDEFPGTFIQIETRGWFFRQR